MKRCIQCDAEMDWEAMACAQCGFLNRRSASQSEALEVFLRRLQRKAADPRRATYMRESFPEPPEKMAANPVRPPATAAECQRVEEQLGMSLPRVVEVVYTTVGNGGFGPGYGLYDLDEAVASYAIYASPDPSQYPGWSWPKGLLPICDWGCAVYSFLDCARPEAAVYRFGYDQYEAGNAATYFADVSAAVFSQEAESFQLWLEWWLDGTLRF